RPSALSVFFFLCLLRLPPRAPLFPYTTLFRSKDAGDGVFGWASRLFIDDPEHRGQWLRSGVGSTPASQCLGHGVHERRGRDTDRSEEHTSELQSLTNLVCRLLLGQKKHTSVDL